jgi:hypothetical protein
MARQEAASSAARAAGRDDRVFRETRALSLFIAPFLVAGFVLLYLLPDTTGQLFAWAIKPRMTAMMLGAAYLGGTYFFLRAAVADRWHLVHAGFPGVAVFAGLLGVATILHWDRFNHQHVTFWVWAALYFTTPFLVLAVWLRNRRTDPGPDAQELSHPAPFRHLLVGLGVLDLAIAAVLFLLPGVASQAWPWALTPLTARVVASLFALTGVAQLAVASDRRRDAGAITLQSQAIALALIDVAVVFSWSSFRPSSPLTWVFVAGLLGLLIVIAVVLAGDARRQRRAPA